VSGWQIFGAVSAHHHQPLHQLQRCIDAVAPGGVSWCVASSSGASAPPAAPSERSVRGATGPGAMGVTPRPTQVVVPSGPASTPPSTQPSTPRPATPARRRLPHKGPVPGGTGGNTSPPHTGPRP
jgi:hypothetical protein